MKVRHHALQHGDHIVTMDYCDVTSPCLYGARGQSASCSQLTVLELDATTTRPNQVNACYCALCVL